MQNIRSMYNQFSCDQTHNRKMWVYLTRLSSFSEVMQLIRDFVFSASSFGRDHSELDNSRMDDRDAYSKIRIRLKNHSIYMSINTSCS